MYAINKSKLKATPTHLPARLIAIACALAIYTPAHAAENLLDTKNSVAIDASNTSPKADSDNTTLAETTANSIVNKSKSPEKQENLEEMVITERADTQIGIADSASQGNIGQEQIKYKPITRPGEILETVPGMIASQHSGEGKAPQYYLRGFNLDHGTDFLTQVDGVPVNLTSHAHGQGWMDTNFLIPELIETVRYQKGNYYAENGDFSSAGAADIHYFKKLPNNTVKFTGGMFDYYRGYGAGSLKLGEGNLLFAGEIINNGGPWTVSNDYQKFNAVVRYSVDRGETGWSLTGMAYKADWNATDQIPLRALQNGWDRADGRGLQPMSRWDTIDPTDGGGSQRYSLTGEWHRNTSDSSTKVMLYGLYSKLDLFSNFSYFLDHPEAGQENHDPNHIGDQFAQPDDRWQTGLKATHTLFHNIGSAESESTVGLQIRNDNVDNGLLLTQARQTKAVTREDNVWVTSISPYFDNKTRWNDWFRTNIGVRFDGFRFRVNNSNIADNNGERYDGIVSPKLGLIFGPWADTEFYLNGGMGFHSNDGRGVNTRIDPASKEAVDRAVPLARTYGAEVGARTTWVKGLQSTLAIWWLDIDSELLFIGDAGNTEATRPSRRYGLEFANYYSPTDWLTFDADLSFSESRFQGDDPGGNHIPGSIETVIAAGATIHDFHGFFGGPRLRYFGPRPLIEDNSIRSDSTILLSAMLGYKFNKVWSLQAEVFNILNREDSAIDYYYASRLPGEAGAVDDIHLHPVEPVNFRIGVSAQF